MSVLEDGRGGCGLSEHLSVQSVFELTAFTQLRVTLGVEERRNRRRSGNVIEPLPTYIGVSGAFDTAQNKEHSALKISSDSATSSSQDRHRLGVGKGNLTLPIEFQSHGKVVGPQLTQSLVEGVTDAGGGGQTGRCHVAKHAPVKWNK